MTSRGRHSSKRKLSTLAGLEALNTFKVPKKAIKKSLLEPVPLDSIDYLEDIYPQVEHSLRFPELSEYLEIGHAWLVHNCGLENSFTAARKRIQKVTSNSSTSETSLCTGFLISNNWSEVQRIAAEGLRPGNDPDTWLGDPKCGLTVNQCADLAVAYAQSQLSNSRHSSHTTSLYLIIVRWIRSKAYIVPPEISQSADRLDPQPGFACHVSTWSRRDTLDANKLSLHEACQLSQVYLYEFDEDLELRPELVHVLPYGVVECNWNLTKSSAKQLSSTNGAILIISSTHLMLKKHAECATSVVATTTTTTTTTDIITADPTSDNKNVHTKVTDSVSMFTSPRGGLLPTPSVPPVMLLSKSNRMTHSKNPYKYTNPSTRLRNFAKTRPVEVINRIHPNKSSRSNRSRDKSNHGISDQVANAEAPIIDVGNVNSSGTIINSTATAVNTTITNNNSSSSSSSDCIASNAIICQARKFQTNSELSKHFGQMLAVINSNTATYNNNNNDDDVKVNEKTGSDCTQSTLINLALLIWGYPKPDHSLTFEVYSYRRGLLAPFDGMLQPCFQIQRLVSLNALHYALAGLQPWPMKSMDPNGPPVLVSVSPDQEWCLPRLQPSMAATLCADPTPLAGYRGNYFRFILHDVGGVGYRTEMAQFCEVLKTGAMAAVIPMCCDESSLLFLFPECQFSKSIGLPPANDLKQYFLHAILLTPYDLENYPYQCVRCGTCTLDPGTVSTATADEKTAGPMSPKFINAPISNLNNTTATARSEALFGQRKRAPVIKASDPKLKLSLTHILSSLSDNGKNLLGNALISNFLTNTPVMNTKHEVVECTKATQQSVEQTQQSQSPIVTFNRSDPRLNRHRPPTVDAPQSSLSSSSAVSFTSGIDQCKQTCTGVVSQSAVSLQNDYKPVVKVTCTTQSQVDTPQPAPIVHIVEPSSPEQDMLSNPNIDVNNNNNNININNNGVSSPNSLCCLKLPKEIPLDVDTSSKMCCSSPIFDVCSPSPPPISPTSNNKSDVLLSSLEQSDMEIDHSLSIINDYDDVGNDRQQLELSNLPRQQINQLEQTQPPIPNSTIANIISPVKMQYHRSPPIILSDIRSSASTSTSIRLTTKVDHHDELSSANDNVHHNPADADSTSTTRVSTSRIRSTKTPAGMDKRILPSAYENASTRHHSQSENAASGRSRRDSRSRQKHSSSTRSSYYTRHGEEEDDRIYSHHRDRDHGRYHHARHHHNHRSRDDRDHHLSRTNVVSTAHRNRGHIDSRDRDYRDRSYIDRRDRSDGAYHNRNYTEHRDRVFLHGVSEEEDDDDDRGQTNYRDRDDRSVGDVEHHGSTSVYDYGHKSHHSVSNGQLSTGHDRNLMESPAKFVTVSRSAFHLIDVEQEEGEVLDDDEEEDEDEVRGSGVDNEKDSWYNNTNARCNIDVGVNASKDGRQRHGRTRKSSRVNWHPPVTCKTKPITGSGKNKSVYKSHTEDSNHHYRRGRNQQVNDQQSSRHNSQSRLNSSNKPHDRMHPTRNQQALTNRMMEDRLSSTSTTTLNTISDQSVRDLETSLEDEDMRHPDYMHQRRQNPYRTHPRAVDSIDLNNIRSSDNDDTDEHRFYPIQTQDTDYRHLLIKSSTETSTPGVINERRPSLLGDYVAPNSLSITQPYQTGVYRDNKQQSIYQSISKWSQPPVLIQCNSLMESIPPHRTIKPMKKDCPLLETPKMFPIPSSASSSPSTLLNKPPGLPLLMNCQTDLPQIYQLPHVQPALLNQPNVWH